MVVQVQLGAVAGGRGGEPHGDAGEDAGVGLPAGVVQRHVPAPWAEVVAPALQLRYLHPARRRKGRESRFFFGRAQGLEEQRDVLRHDLLLQVDGVGGNDDAAVLLQREAERGQEVGQRLPGAGARLGHEVLLLVEGLGDGPHHRHLLGAVLEAAEDAGEGACRTKERRKQVRVELVRLRAGRLPVAGPVLVVILMLHGLGNGLHHQRPEVRHKSLLEGFLEEAPERPPSVAPQGTEDVEGRHVQCDGLLP